MQKIYANTDLYIEVVVYDAEGNVIPLNQINFLTVELYTHSRCNAAVFDKRNIDASNNMCVPWQELQKLPSGVLKYYYQVNYSDPGFADGTYDYANEFQTDVYLVNATPCECRPGAQYSDQYVTRLWLAKHGIIDASTEAFVTDYELAAALEAYAKSQGTQGEIGTQGVVGTQGFEGAQGVAGTPGVQGVEGTPGAQGPDGKEGPQGPVGTQGVIGTQGFDGAQGVDGNPGPDGQQGTQGVVGTQGAIGTQGFDGAQGPVGTQGEQGAQGYPGPVELEDYYNKDQIDASMNELSDVMQEDEEVVAESLMAVNKTNRGLMSILEEDEEIIADTFIAMHSKIADLDASIAEMTPADYTQEFLAIDSSLDTLNSTVTTLDSSITQFSGMIQPGTGSHSIMQVSPDAYMGNSASGNYAISFGKRNVANGEAGFAQGIGNHANGASSHSEGVATWATTEGAHAEGYNSQVNNANYGHAEGYDTRVSGVAAHAEGQACQATSSYSHAEGSNAKTYATGSHAEGYYTVTYNEYEHAQGKYNKSTSDYGHPEKCTAFSHGIGTSDSSRGNAIEIMQNGDIYIIGIGGYDGTNYSSAQTLQEVITALTS